MTRTMFLALTAAAVLLSACERTADPQPSLDNMIRHIKTLSSDEFEGRQPSTPGEEKTIAYLEAEFAKAGFAPGGEAGSWRQPVTLNRFLVTGTPTINLTVGGTTKALTQGEDAVVSTRGTVDREISIQNAPLVFVGYGVSAPDLGWDDYKGVDLKGKVAVVLVNDPDFETPEPGKFNGRAITYYGRHTYKYEEMARRGAAGTLVVHEDAPASYGWATVRNSWGGERRDIQHADIGAVRAPLEGWIQRATAVDLFKAAGLDFEAAKESAKTAAFQPVELPGAAFSTTFAVEAGATVTNNVVARLEGTAHPKETVIYTAHWDHLGVGLPDASGDRIFNGAVDNATGTAALIELARMFASAPKPERSVVMLVVTAEEGGLLGSEFYASNPIYPLETTVADLNMDAMRVVGASRDLQVIGSGKNELEDMLAVAAKKRNMVLVPDANPEAGIIYRSDQFNFAKKGVPVLYVKGGDDLIKGGLEAGRAAEAAYRKDNYHQPADEWDDSFDLTGVLTEISMFYEIGRELATTRAWPNWREGDEFRALRDSTAAARGK